MKKGINIWSFPQGTIKENLTLAKNAGFEGVELALNGTGELSMESTESEIKEVKKIADRITVNVEESAIAHIIFDLERDIDNNVIIL